MSATANRPSTCVTIQCRCDDRREEAAALARRLGTRCVDGARVPVGEFRIVLLEHGTELWDEHSRRRGMPVDFRSLDRRTGSGSLSHKQPIAKAIGRSARTVVDATAGLGHDSFLLACLGWHVVAMERHPVVGVLLEESVRLAREDAEIMETMGDRLRVQSGDARALLQEQDPPDVIYLDPMFQPRRTSALPRKPAQVLRQLVGLDQDELELFEVARRCARQRVVVKRADDAPPLVEGVDLSHRGKIVRYDVYLPLERGS
ncbi:MAG: class I SAM-dependent methyltransferase [Phycisphaerales bacterium]|nr:class I SAM-dependent methyltransferase [Phycisphaerales bacterium]